MNVPHPEQWLVALLLAFYLKDCLLLLRPDEAVLRRGLRGRWQAGFGLRDWTLRGREPYMCHPLRPFEPVWRVPWLSDPVAAAAPCQVQVPAVLAALRPWVAGIWLSLFVLLPVCLFMQAPLVLTSAVLTLIYLQIGAALAITWRARARLELDGPRFATLAAEVLACPPYAANLLRKLSLSLAHRDDLSGAIARWMDEAGQSKVRTQCRARLTAHIAQFDAEDPQVAALTRLRRHFGADD